MTREDYLACRRTDNIAPILHFYHIEHKKGKEMSLHEMLSYLTFLSAVDLVNLNGVFEQIIHFMDNKFSIVLMYDKLGKLIKIS